jgi:hypothetical protein
LQDTENPPPTTNSVPITGKPPCRWAHLPHPPLTIGFKLHSPVRMPYTEMVSANRKLPHSRTVQPQSNWVKTDLNLNFQISISILNL